MGGMNIRNVLQKCVFSLAVGAALFCVPAERVLAANTTMSQQILPVRFVYLEKDGSIERVWSNVTEKDAGYVVKFFDKKQKEVSMDKKMILKYVEKSGEVAISRQSTQQVQFVESSYGIEEIKTVV